MDRFSDIFEPDYSALVSRSDLTYNGMIDFGPYGMPVANGRFGGPVWQKDARTLSMQLNHTDTFMYNDASANSTYENGSLGRLEIDFGGEVFGDFTSNHLSLYDARLNIESADISVEVIADNASDTVLIRVTDSRAEPQDIQQALMQSIAPLPGECLMRNPWGGKIDLYRNGVKSEILNGKENSLLNFRTKAGEKIVMVRHGADPEQSKTAEVIN